jgi:hypothetical protein
MSEQHLDLLTSVPRTSIIGVREGSGYIASILIEIARHFALRRVRAAFRLEGAAGSRTCLSGTAASHPW